MKNVQKAEVDNVPLKRGPVCSMYGSVGTEDRFEILRSQRLGLRSPRSPKTVPGAFFWKNAGFVEHARETGLADMPQMGVVYERHHQFKIADLINTIKNTSMSDKVDQFKRVFTG